MYNGVCMKKNKRQIGMHYERLAGAYLKTRGYEILQYNFCCRMGEIDIIARDGEYLVFCEVKYRDTEEKGHPLESVSYAKQRKISQCALYYISKQGYTDMAYRFDVIGILEEEIILIKNAFDFRL